MLREIGMYICFVRATYIWKNGIRLYVCMYFESISRVAIADVWAGLTQLSSRDDAVRPLNR